MDHPSLQRVWQPCTIGTSDTCRLARLDPQHAAPVARLAAFGTRHMADIVERKCERGCRPAALARGSEQLAVRAGPCCAARPGRQRAPRCADNAATSANAGIDKEAGSVWGMTERLGCSLYVPYRTDCNSAYAFVPSSQHAGPNPRFIHCPGNTQSWSPMKHAQGNPDELKTKFWKALADCPSSSSSSTVRAQPRSR